MHLLYLVIFAAPLIINPEALEIFTVSKVSWVMGILGVSLIISGIYVVQKRTITIRYHHGLFIFLALLLLSYWISNALSVAPIQSFWGTYQSMIGTYLAILLGWHLLLFLNLFQTKKSWMAFFTAQLAVAAVLVIHSISQHLGYDPVPHASDEAFMGRVYSMVGQPNMLGQYLIFPLVISFFLLTSIKKKWKRFLLTILSIGLILTLILTVNRASILGLIIAFGLYALSLTSFSRKKKIAIVLAGISALFVGGTLVLPEVRSWNTRFILWMQSLPLIAEYPLFGSGLHTFYQTFQTVLPVEFFNYEGLYTIPQNVHNEFLSVILERGLFGAALYLVHIGFLIRVYLKKNLTTIFAKIAWVSLVAFTISIQFSFATIDHLPVLLAMWGVFIMTQCKFKNRVIELTRPLQVGLIAALLISGAAAVQYAITFSASDMLFKQAISQYVFEPEQSQKTYAEMFSLRPPFGYMYDSFLALFIPFMNENTTLAKPVVDYLDRYARITNNDFRYHLYHAEVASMQSSYAARDTHYSLAASKAPNSPLVYEEWGRTAHRAGHYARAQDKLEKLESLAPRFWVYRRGTPEFDQYAEFTFRKTHGRFLDAMELLVKIYRTQGQHRKANMLQSKL